MCSRSPPCLPILLSTEHALLNTLLSLHTRIGEYALNTLKQFSYPGSAVKLAVETPISGDEHCKRRSAGQNIVNQLDQSGLAPFQSLRQMTGGNLLIVVSDNVNLL